MRWACGTVAAAVPDATAARASRSKMPLAAERQFRRSQESEDGPNAAAAVWEAR